MTMWWGNLFDARGFPPPQDTEKQTFHIDNDNDSTSSVVQLPVEN